MKKIVFILFVFISAQALAQENFKREFDSLTLVLSSNPVDTIKIKVLNELARVQIEDEPKKAFVVAKQAEALAQKLNNKHELGKAYFSIGHCYDQFQLYADALNYYFKSLAIREEEGNKKGLVRLYNQIGIIYSQQKNNEAALKYFTKFARMAESMNDKGLMANVYNNIGVTYKELGKINLAKDSYKKALDIFTEKKFDRGIASCLINLGVAYDVGGDDDTALIYDYKALSIFRKMGSKYGMNTCYINIGEVFNKIGQLDRSIQYYDSGMAISLSTRDKFHLKDTYDGLYKVYEKKHDYTKAFNNLKLFLATRDSVFSEESTQRSQANEASYEMMTKQNEIEGLKVKDELKEADIQRQNAWITVLVLGVLLFVVIAFLFFSRSKLKQKQNEVLELHNIEVEHQKKEITDSINYAKRIQMSILPPDSLVNELLPDSFVLYKPKDIVSGDFYWVEECKGKSLFAAVDCTGHGVPGAMMSVLGFNLLSQATNEKKLTKPSEILEHLDVGVDKMLRQSTDTNSVRDGMDLSLCSMDYKTGILQFAGAYNPLWMVKHKTREFIEIKADKMMIGVNAGGQADHFTNHEIQLEKGDAVYIFSDGYADQFGGPGGKKFKYKPLKSLLIDIHELPMTEQKIKLDENVEKWRGNLEQVDDILVIGIRY